MEQMCMKMDKDMCDMNMMIRTKERY
jgi:hypothetical protein